MIDSEGNSYVYGYVPIVVAKCGVFLKEKATNVEGIFRLSGSEKRIKELRQTFDSPDRYGKGLDWEGYTVHDAANVLRRYLNQLPEPIVPLDLYDRFREPLREYSMHNRSHPWPKEDMDRIILQYQRLITELPPLNRQLLLYILDLLAVFASKADENRMTSGNLAAIFQPGMLSHPQHDMAPGEYRLSQDVLVFLIENQDNFLIGMRGTEADENTVKDVQKGAPSPATSMSRKNAGVYRSASNASAGADSLRRQGGVRRYVDSPTIFQTSLTSSRNVSVNSRQSHHSNGGPSPSSPAMQPLTASTGNGVHRSNTVPSKRLASSGSRLQKSPQSPSQFSSVNHTPVAATPTTTQSPSTLAAPPPPIGIFRSPIEDAHTGPPATAYSEDPNAARQTAAAPASTISAPSIDQSGGTQSQDRLLPSHESPDNNVLPVTPKEERGNFFLRATSTSDSEKRPPPNKLRKKRLPSSQNPSAQSSSQSLSLRQVSGEHSPSGHDRIPLSQNPEDAAKLESIPSGQALNAASPGPNASSPLAAPPAPQAGALSPAPIAQPVPTGGQDKPLQPPQPAYIQTQYDGALKPQESVTSLDSRNIPNATSTEHSEIDPMTDDQGVSSGGEQKEKRNIWRMSRRPKEDKDKKKEAGEPGRLSPGSPKKSAIGSNNGADTSTTSFGSGGQGWRKSFQQEQMPSMDQLANEPSNGASTGGDKDKRGMVGWLKGKIRGDDDKRGRDNGRDSRGRTGSEQSQPNEFRNRSSEMRRNTQGEGIPEVREGPSRAPLE